MAKLKEFIDRKAPWDATRRDWNRPWLAYTKSQSQWNKLLQRAERGDAEAEWEVGDCYREGCRDRQRRVIVGRSRRKALLWLRRAAEHGSSAAQNTLGVMLTNGHGSKNIQEALSWLRKAFKSGHSIAAQNIAITYRENGDLRKAVEWFRKSAESSDGDALVLLGVHYYWGKGVSKQPVTALRCFRTAMKSKFICEAGKEDACFWLGLAYFEGKGVPMSLRRAIELFERANVDDDNPAARTMLEHARRAMARGQHGLSKSSSPKA